jgi:hypothetical protein
MVASNPGSADLELLPERGTTFDIKGQSGVSIEFKRDTNGKVSEAALNDDGTMLVLKKE